MLPLVTSWDFTNAYVGRRQNWEAQLHRIFARDQFSLAEVGVVRFSCLVQEDGFLWL